MLTLAARAIGRRTVLASRTCGDGSSTFVRETARAPQAAVAFRDADRAAIGELAADSQREADELLGNQIPETILMAKLARDHGAFASSSFGAGFGGSVWALVPAAEAAAFGERWIARLRTADAAHRQGARGSPRARARPPRKLCLTDPLTKMTRKCVFRCGSRHSSLLISISCSSQPPAPAMPPFDTTISVKDLMANVIDPTADVVWESVGTIMTKEGTFEKAPANDDEWNAVKASAITLVEVGNLLMMPARSGGNRRMDQAGAGADRAKQARHQGRRSARQGGDRSTSAPTSTKPA